MHGNLRTLVGAADYALTVVEMEPLGNEYETGYSDFDQRQVPMFYGSEGPGPLHVRDVSSQ